MHPAILVCVTRQEPGEASQPRVRVLDAHGRVVDVAPLTPAGITIGRALHNTIVLPSRAISSSHLRVDLTPSGTVVTATDLGSATGTFIDGVRLNPNSAYPWDGQQPLRLGDYSLRLILPVPAPAQVAAPMATDPVSHPPDPRSPWRWWPIVLSTLFGLSALAVLLYSLAARPAEIVAFDLTADPAQPVVRFTVANARRVALTVNGQPADPARYAFDPLSGQGTYDLAVPASDVELVAYNALGQGVRSRLAFSAPAPAPTVTATPHPTHTPQPEQVAFAAFLFNGVNKVDDLSDIVINRGDPLVIQWEAVNADNVELQPAGTFQARDAIRVAPNETTIYTLIGRNMNGEARRSVKVIVVDAQATASADATAAAQVRATRDAQATLESRLAGEATASAQATATGIAGLLAQAQAAASTRATQDAQSAAAAAAAANARETAQAIETAVTRATQEAAAQAAEAATAVIQGTAVAAAARYGQYNGTWVNDDPTTDGITRLIIANVGPTLTVQAFSRCQPQECGWGARSRAFTGEPFEIVFEFGDGVVRRLTLAREGDALRVTDADSRGPVRAYRLSRSP
jgi:hypothetical protein